MAFGRARVSLSYSSALFTRNAEERIFPSVRHPPPCPKRRGKPAAAASGRCMRGSVLYTRIRLSWMRGSSISPGERGGGALQDVDHAPATVAAGRARGARKGSPGAVYVHMYGPCWQASVTEPGDPRFYRLRSRSSMAVRCCGVPELTSSYQCWTFRSLG